MPVHSPIRRPALRLLAVAVVTAAGALTLAATPGAGHPLPPQGGTVIQVRDFPSSAIVEIVAWNAAQPSFGLRTWVRRSGAPDRYHRLWVSLETPGGRDVAKAQGLNRPLPVTTATDTENCLNGKCAPNATFGARLPDNQLRAAKEDVVVTFFTGSGAELAMTARRALVDAYLGTVDSVITALKK